ncbi:hypothetical protein KCP78_10650 [Salmonella enterica subsp. enterica]|nr:hypothetical protein KCP78_10650 [Salmonella enterica subsp. enterica]
MTPKGQQAWRARRLREALAKREPITAAIYRAGFPISSYHRHADQTLGMTAKQFAKAAIRLRSLCADALGLRTAPRWRRASGDLRFSSVIATTRYWLNYTPCSRRPATNLLTLFQQRVRQVVAGYQHTRCAARCRWISSETAFQQRPRQALCAIPCGENRVINSLPRLSAKPTAVRARGRQRVRRE